LEIQLEIDRLSVQNFVKEVNPLLNSGVKGSNSRGEITPARLKSVPKTAGSIEESPVQLESQSFNHQTNNYEFNTHSEQSNRTNNSVKSSAKKKQKYFL
jgi:hypothetical protein